MNLFPALCSHFGVRPDSRGEAHTACPNCGKPAKRGQTHFSFSERGAKCFPCGYTASLAGLYAQLTGGRPLQDVPRPAPVKRQERVAPWLPDAGQLLERYTSALDRADKWAGYKPALFLESIAAYRLGVGVLPFSRCEHRRLIVPLLRDGQPVGFCGRKLACGPECESGKWTSAWRSQIPLFVAGELEAAGCIVVTESPVSAILARQAWPDETFLATFSAGAWKEGWTERLAVARPRRVIVMLDADDAGWGNAVKLANRLLAARIPAEPFRWPEDTPDKYDLADLASERVGAWIAAA